MVHERAQTILVAAIAVTRGQDPFHLLGRNVPAQDIPDIFSLLELSLDALTRSIVASAAYEDQETTTLRRRRYVVIG
jgi:hypothetical protein